MSKVTQQVSSWLSYSSKRDSIFQNRALDSIFPYEVACYEYISTHVAQKLETKFLSVLYPELSSHLPAQARLPLLGDNPLPASDKPFEWLTPDTTFSSTQCTEITASILPMVPFKGHRSSKKPLSADINI